MHSPLQYFCVDDSKFSSCGKIIVILLKQCATEDKYQVIAANVGQEANRKLLLDFLLFNNRPFT